MIPPIDMVYLWCDMHDEKWNALRVETAKKFNVTLSGDGNGACRCMAHDELKYSLRSLDMYAPWIRKVFIVVDDVATLPSWLDTDNPRLRIVRLSEIMPKNILPVFNSVTIEYHICNIPDLSEYFLYGNDDMLFGSKVDPSFFFTDSGNVVVRFECKGFKGSSSLCYIQQLLQAYKLLCRRYANSGKEEILREIMASPHHNIDSYRKSHFMATVERYREELEPTFQFPFRKPTNYQRMLILWEEIMEYDAPYYFVGGDSGGTDSLVIYGHFRKNGISRLFDSPYSLMCFNDGTESTDDDYAWYALAMEVLYPRPSSFERG